MEKGCKTRKIFLVVANSRRPRTPASLCELPTARAIERGDFVEIRDSVPGLGKAGPSLVESATTAAADPPTPRR